jgi:hypothetical protein
MIDTVYFRQAELLLRVLPLVDRETVFAMVDCISIARTCCTNKFGKL